MRCKIPLIALAFALAPGVLRADDAPRKGTFEVSFKDRSALTEAKILTKRLGVATPAADYDLEKNSFLMNVPEDYDPAKPMGLLVLVNYKQSDDVPQPVLPQLAKANMAFVVAKEFPDVWWHRAGLAIDAVSNIEKQYHIDPRRVYVMGGAEPPDASGKPPAVALRLGLNFPEVFTGTVAIGVMSYRPVTAANGGNYRAEIPRPEARSFDLAKSHPFVLACSEPADQWQRFANSYKADGFRYIKYTTISHEQFHYPIYTTDWLPGTIEFLDDATAKLKTPATQPGAASRP